MWHRLASVLSVTVLTVAGLAAPAAAAGPVAATTGDHATTRYYLALGDSLAYGYQPVKPLDRAQGYVYRIHDARPGETLSNLGCPGETTTTMVDGRICPYPGGASQLVTAERFLRAHPGQVSLITLDIGANDITPCARGGVIDDACVRRAYATIAVNLARIVLPLRLLASHARFVAMTYYNPNLAAYLTGPAGRLLAARALVVGDGLNAVLALVYRLAGIAVADVSAAFRTHVTTPTDVPGLGTIPRNVAVICALTWMCAPPPQGPDIHANAQGYALIAQTFLARIPAR